MAGVPRRGRHRVVRPRVRHGRRPRVRARVGTALHRGAVQEPVRGPHLYPAQHAAAQAGRGHEVRRAVRGGGRQADRPDRRLDRARQHHQPHHQAAAGRGRQGGAHSRGVAAPQAPLLHGHQHPHQAGAGRQPPRLGAAGGTRRRGQFGVPLCEGTGSGCAAWRED